MWDEMLEMAMSTLHITEDEFWNMRPLKYVSLVRAYNKRINRSMENNDSPAPPKPKKQVVDTTVDKLPAWW